jgi:hypothetical protein
MARPPTTPLSTDHESTSLSSERCVKGDTVFVATSDELARRRLAEEEEEEEEKQE